MASDLIRSEYRRTWWSLLLRGITSLLVGAVILWRPMESVAAFALVIAVWALFSGIIHIVHAFDLRVVYSRWWVMLLSGIVNVAFGIAALYYYPILSLTFAVVWVAWWLLFTGILAVSVAIQERRMGVPWGWTLTFGILALVGGVFALMSPPVTLGAIMGLIAGFAVVSGAVLLIGAFKLSSVRRELTASIGTARPA